MNNLGELIKEKITYKENYETPISRWSAEVTIGDTEVTINSKTFTTEEKNSKYVAMCLTRQTSSYNNEAKVSFPEAPTDLPEVNLPNTN